MIQQLNAADPALKLDQEQTLRKWTASLRLKEAELLLENNKITEAIAAFNRIEQMDSTVISAQSWNNLCWQGALGGHPAQVLDACEKAVHAATAEQSWEIRDSRGLARALTGNRQGASRILKFILQKPIMKSLKSSAKTGCMRYGSVRIHLPKRSWLRCGINNLRLPLYTEIKGYRESRQLAFIFRGDERLFMIVKLMQRNPAIL